MRCRRGEDSPVGPVLWDVEQVWGAASKIGQLLQSTAELIFNGRILIEKHVQLRKDFNPKILLILEILIKSAMKG